MSSLNDAQFNHYALSFAHQLAEGWLYEWDDFDTIASLGSRSYSFVTGPKPFLLMSAIVDFTGTTALGVGFFVGGTVSGGDEITEVFPRNHHNPQESPYAANSVFENRTIDVPGVEFMDFVLLNPSRSDIGGAAGGGFILSPNQLYYLTLTNLGNQEATFDLIMLAGSER